MKDAIKRGCAKRQKQPNRYITNKPNGILVKKIPLTGN